MSVDLLKIFADDKRIISYRPQWRQFTGSVTATILLQQILFRWDSHGRQPFYKFKEPCEHPLYIPGDSWVEELDFSRHEFDSAIQLIGFKISQKRQKAHTKPVEYWIDASRLTYYTIHEENLTIALNEVYRIAPQQGQTPVKPESGFTKSHAVKPESGFTKSRKAAIDLNVSEITSEITNVVVAPPLQKFCDEFGLTPAFLRQVAEKHQLISIDELIPAIAYYRQQESTNNRNSMVKLLRSGEAFQDGVSIYAPKYAPVTPPNGNRTNPPGTQRPSANPNDGNPATWWAQHILPALEKRINRPSFNTWLRPTTCLHVDAATCEIGVPDDVFSYWLSEHFLSALHDEITKQIGRKLDVIFTVVTKESE